MEEEKKDAICFENHAQDARYRETGEVAPTCHSQMGTGGNNVPLVYTMDSYEGNSMKSANPNSGFHESDVAKTLDTTTPTPSKNQGGQMVIAAIDGDKINKKERKGGSGLGIHTEDVSYTCTAKDVHGVALADAAPVRIETVVDMMGGKAGCHVSDEDVSPTLATTHGDSHAVALAGNGDGRCLNPHDPQSERIYADDGAWHSLNANSGGGQSRDGVLAFGKTGHPENASQPQGWDSAQVAKTLNTFGTPSSEMRAEELVCVHGSQDPICNTDGHSNAVNTNQGQKNCVCGNLNDSLCDIAHNLRIRRLLPTETERLMGFPDGHTVPCFKEEDITDELVDYFIGVFWTWDCVNAKEGKVPKRKTRAQVRKWLEKISNPAACPDAPRYKAAGNSMCTNVMRWIGLSIEDVENRHKGE